MIVAVLPNLDKRGSSETVEKMATFFKDCGITAYLPDSICCAGYEHAPEEELFKIADVIVTIGGDGTIIRFAKQAALYNKAVLGVNAGRVGYLANIEQNEYKLLSKLKNGEYQIEERMMIHITVKENGNIVNEFDALNDAVISSGYLSRIIDVTASVDGGEVIVYHADGLIASTPTGSTAYSMSAGGPVIDPSMKCVCLTPICSHSLAAKPILISGEKSLKLKAFSKKRTDICLTVDGRKVCNIRPFTEIYITQSQQNVKLIRLNERSFYKTLSLKFRDARSGM